MSKTILVAGATGFVGSQTLAALQAMDDVCAQFAEMQRNRVSGLRMARALPAPPHKVSA